MVDKNFQNPVLRAQQQSLTPRSPSPCCDLGKQFGKCATLTLYGEICDPKTALNQQGYQIRLLVNRISGRSRDDGVLGSVITP